MPGIALEGLVGAFQKPEGRDEQIYQVFGGYRGKVFRGGLQYVRKEMTSGNSESRNEDRT